MKNYFKFILLSGLVAASTSSCNEWLDVQPTTDKSKEELTETATGFEQMLYGAYITLTDEAIYGRHLSFGFLEGLARNYYPDPIYSGWTTPRFEYTRSDIRPTIDAMWSKMYNSIANINSILSDIEDKKDVFLNGEGEILEGEALAMRAYLHFDLMRLFAPAYSVDCDATAIPYVESFERVRYPHISVKEVCAKVLADLEKAEKCLANDPAKSEVKVTYSGKGDFLANRQYRFNYWAVKATEARVYLYMGETEKANACATEVIEQSPLGFVTESQVIQGDHVFVPELICALDVPDLPNRYDSYFKSELYNTWEPGYWGGPTSWGSTIFEDVNDYRYLYNFTNASNGLKDIPCKYNQEIGSSKVLKKQTIPLIRLGEMYLIAAECNAQSNPAKSIELLRSLKSHRGYLTADAGVADGLTADGINAIIRKEMRKETYAEGQSWFYYKRLQSSSLPEFSSWSPYTSIKIEQYTFPIPESEKEYGNIPSSEGESENN